MPWGEYIISSDWMLRFITYTVILYFGQTHFRARHAVCHALHEPTLPASTPGACGESWQIHPLTSATLQHRRWRPAPKSTRSTSHPRVLYPGRPIADRRLGWQPPQPQTHRPRQPGRHHRRYVGDGPCAPSTSHPSALVANLAGCTSALLSIDGGATARVLRADVLYPVAGFKRCLDLGNGFGTTSQCMSPHSSIHNTEFIYPDRWLADQTVAARQAQRRERQFALDPPPTLRYCASDPCNQHVSSQGQAGCGAGRCVWPPRHHWRGKLERHRRPHPAGIPVRAVVPHSLARIHPGCPRWVIQPPLARRLCRRRWHPRDPASLQPCSTPSNGAHQVAVFLCSCMCRTAVHCSPESVAQDGAGRAVLHNRVHGGGATFSATQRERHCQCRGRPLHAQRAVPNFHVAT